MNRTDHDHDHVSLGRFVAGLKAPRDKVRDRAAFLDRCAAKANAPMLGGMPMVGLGGSCGKPAFLLPFIARFTDANLARLERLAAARGMFVEYGAYPHLKREDGGQEIAAIQDWTQSTLIFLRPSYDDKEGLLQDIREALTAGGSHHDA